MNGESILYFRGNDSNINLNNRSFCGYRMPYPILSTKLNLPRLRSQAIVRQNLIRRLDDGLGQHLPLSLVCAPAGYGKTTLVVEWLSLLSSENLPAGEPSLPEKAALWRTAWLSLDELDDEPIRFLAYFAAAIQSAVPGACKSLRALLENPQLPPVENLVSIVIDDLQNLGQPVILVLDDLHWIQSLTIQRFLSRFIEYLPQALHLVLITREEPFLPLERMRGRGLVTELRTDDLRFDREESTAFLNQCMGLEVKEEWAHELSQWSEGWAAGLQLAGLSMQRQPDYPEFISSFRGKERFAIDYLMKEVLYQLPEELQHFLMKTAILGRLCSPLCSAVTGREDSQQILEQLEQKNLFIVPLDDEHTWYRYHHLFGDLLRRQLRLTVTQEEIDDLHRRAAIWLEKNSLISEAIEQAGAIQAWGLVEQFIMDHSNDCFRSGAITLLLEWMRVLPETSLEANDQLCSDYGWALAVTNQPDRAGEYFQRAEKGFQDQPDRLGRVLAGQAYAAVFSDRPEQSVELGQRALSLLAPENRWMRSVCWMTLGIAYYELFDVERSEAAMQAVLRCGQTAGRSQVTALAYLGLIQMIHLDFDEAQRFFDQAIAADASGQPVPGCDIAFTYLAFLRYERGQLAEALQWAQKGLAMSRVTGNVILEDIQDCLMARAYQSMGRLAEASAVLQEAQARVSDQPHKSHWFSINAAYQMELELAKGDMAAAAWWASGTSADIWFPFVGFPGLARAHWLLIKNEKQEAGRLLSELYQQAKEAGWAAPLFRINLLRALNSPNPEQARQILIECLEEARPRRLIQPFLDLGQPMLENLVKVNIRQHAPHLSDFVDQILAAAIQPGQIQWIGAPAPQKISTISKDLVEPLSDRELEVLRLLREEPEYEEIARKLVLSTNTIKTHIKHIYGKLGVSNRREALLRARELHLLQT